MKNEPTVEPKKDPPPLFSLPSYGDSGLISLGKKAIRKAQDEDIVSKAAAVAFYAMIALVPILAVVLTLFSILVPVPSELVYNTAHGTSHTVQQLREGMQDLLPRSAFQVVDEQIERINEIHPIATLSAGILAALWTASGAFGTVCKCMNFIYDRPETRNYLKLKLVAFGVTILHTVIFLLVLLAFFLWPIIEPWLALSPEGLAIANSLEWGVFTIAVISSYTLMLHVGPTGRRHHPIITPGALIATPAFMLATWAFRLYVHNVARYSEMYGSLGGVMVLMLWFWLYSIILFSAASVDAVLAEEMEDGGHEQPQVPSSRI
ncbi:MAG: YihY/virulence factor BrkB family protein [Candidatus Obscuribacterales bacterium]